MPLRGGRYRVVKRGGSKSQPTSVFDNVLKRVYKGDIRELIPTKSKVRLHFTDSAAARRTKQRPFDRLMEAR